MSKAYPSKLTHAQYEFLSDMIPEPKSGGRLREVEMWEVLNGIFYVLVEGVRWRALPGDFSTSADSVDIFLQLAQSLPARVLSQADFVQKWDVVKNSLWVCESGQGSNKSAIRVQRSLS